MTTGTLGVALKAEAVPQDQVQRIRDIYREFVSDLRTIASGRIMPLVDGDEDAVGADFAFIFEVKPHEYETVVAAKSHLEARYYFRYGVNFMVVPQAM